MATASGSASVSGLQLRVLSWNIDGLDGKNRDERTREIVQYVRRLTPHIVYLQEVVPPTIEIIRDSLEHSYSVHTSPAPSFEVAYYTAILVSKTCPQLSLVSKAEMFDFPGSNMGRQLLHLSINVCGVRMRLCTSHLESTGQPKCATERKEQLRFCFDYITKRTAKGEVCLFGGDLNLRDKEVSQVGLPTTVLDVWEACGSVEEHKYTWDVSANDNLQWPFPNKPRLRFDRLYLSPKGGELVQPVSFELVGKERIPSCLLRFPSDHWGLLAAFNVSECIVID